MLTMHEHKCSNRRNVISAMFVLVGMMLLLVSAMTEKALAMIFAVAKTPICCFSSIKYHMYEGRFFIPPLFPNRDEIEWVTIGSASPFSGGNERGYIADVGPHHIPVSFHFSNPARGPHTCGVDPPFRGTCTITQGVRASASYHVTYLSSLPPSDVNGRDVNGSSHGDNGRNTS